MTRPWAVAAVLATLATALAVIVLAPATADAGAGPFGVARPDGGVLPGGVGSWLLAQQALFNRQIAAALKASVATGSVPIALVGLSALYGVLHAAGPGHGKAVISAYLFTSGDTIGRGLLLSTAAALLQASVAVGMVAVFGIVIGATAKSMDAATFSLERLSYAVIAVIGLWLTWRKASGLIDVLRRGEEGADHVHGPDCGHLLVLKAATKPARAGRFAAEPAGPTFGTTTAMGAVLAGGLRPCTGALLNSRIFAGTGCLRHWNSRHSCDGAGHGRDRRRARGAGRWTENGGDAARAARSTRDRAAHAVRRGSRRRGDLRSRRRAGRERDLTLGRSGNDCWRNGPIAISVWECHPRLAICQTLASFAKSRRRTS